MSSAPSETTCGSPSSPGRLQPVGAGREDAADELVGELGRRDVEHAGEEAAARERLHRLAAGAGRRGRRAPRSRAPRAARAPRVTHGRRDAEHRRADQRRSPRRAAAPSPWPCRRSRRRRSRGSAPRSGSARRCRRPSTSSSRRRRPRTGACRPRRPSRPSASGRRPGSARIACGGERGAAGAAERRAMPSSRPSVVQARGRPRPRRAPSPRRPRRGRPPPRARRRPAPAAAATSSRVTSGLDGRLAEHAGVDEDDVHAVLAQPVAQEAVLLALRVERAEQNDRGHRQLPRPERSVPGRPRPSMFEGVTPRKRRWGSGSPASATAVVSAKI